MPHAAGGARRPLRALRRRAAIRRGAAPLPWRCRGGRIDAAPAQGACESGLAAQRAAVQSASGRRAPRAAELRAPARAAASRRGAAPAAPPPGRGGPRAGSRERSGGQASGPGGRCAPRASAGTRRASPACWARTTSRPGPLCAAGPGTPARAAPALHPCACSVCARPARPARRAQPCPERRPLPAGGAVGASAPRRRRLRPSSHAWKGRRQACRHAGGCQIFSRARSCREPGPRACRHAPAQRRAGRAPLDQAPCNCGRERISDIHPRDQQTLHVCGLPPPPPPAPAACAWAGPGARRTR